MAMISSLYTAVSGMRSHQTMLDVIANNVANVNTVGFKSSRVMFTDLLSQTMSGAVGGSSLTGRGGVNPVQMGLGSSVAAIQTMSTQGPLQITGNPTDLAINGDGFFMLKSGGQTSYTRAGNFSFDSSGHLVDASGALVQGWMAQPPSNDRLASAVINSTNTTNIGKLQINAGMTQQAQETRRVELVGNLDAGSHYVNMANSAGKSYTDSFTVLDSLGNPYNYVVGKHEVKFSIYDSLGNQHEITATFRNISSTQRAGQPPGVTYGNNQWSITFSTDPNDTSVRLALDNMTYTDPVTGDTVRSGRHGEIHFDSGAINGAPDHGSWVDANTAAELAAQGIVADPHVGYLIGIMNDEIITAGDFAGDVTATFNTAPFFDNPGVAGFAPFDIKKIPLVLVYQDIPGGSPIPPAGSTAGILVNVNYTDMTTTGATPTQMYVQKIELDFGTLATQPDWDLDPDDDGAQGTPTDPYARAHTTLQDGLRDGLTQDVSGRFVTVGGVTEYIPEFTAAMRSQDGYAAGVLQTVQVDSSGTIIGKFSNGQIQPLAQVAVVSFQNPGGLARIGGGHFAGTANSGVGSVGTALTGGRGSIVSGALELSNVDLAKELTDMIIAQRGFEANARLVTTSDRILDTLVNIGR